MREEQSATDDGRVRLRPVGADDTDFLQSVYASTRAEEMRHVPWDEKQKAAFLQMQFEAQTKHYAGHWPEARHDIILFEGESAGRLYVDRRAEEIHILDIALLPEYRGRGIGYSVLSALVSEADKTGKAMSIYVETFNPSRALFERLGFEEKESDGFNLFMNRPPGR